MSRRECRSDSRAGGLLASGERASRASTQEYGQCGQNDVRTQSRGTADTGFTKPEPTCCAPTVRPPAKGPRRSFTRSPEASKPPASG